MIRKKSFTKSFIKKALSFKVNFIQIKKHLKFCLHRFRNQFFFIIENYILANSNSNLVQERSRSGDTLGAGTSSQHTQQAPDLLTLQHSIDTGHKDFFNHFADFSLFAIDESRDEVLDFVIDQFVDLAIAQDTANVGTDTTQTDNSFEFVDLDRAEDERHLVFELTLDGQVLQSEFQGTRAFITDRQTQLFHEIDKGIGVQERSLSLQFLEVEVELDLLVESVGDLQFLDLHIVQAIETETDHLDDGAIKLKENNNSNKNTGCLEGKFS